MKCPNCGKDIDKVRFFARGELAFKAMYQPTRIEHPYKNRAEKCILDTIDVIETEILAVFCYSCGIKLKLDGDIVTAEVDKWAKVYGQP